MLLLRAVLAVAMVLCGIVILARMLQALSAGFAILPGVVLAAAMIALGAHRIALILRARRMT
ncbi:MAG: hypothetical protein JO104_00455 [Candidatus Eremiobacteraeota bacterium]|nr:hypothetical protein [Candidatus Eremiobacteraeota bacterium]